MARCIRPHQSWGVSKLHTGKKKAETTEQHRTPLHLWHSVLLTGLKPPRGRYLSGSREVKHQGKRLFSPRSLWWGGWTEWRTRCIIQATGENGMDWNLLIREQLVQSDPQSATLDQSTRSHREWPGLARDSAQHEETRDPALLWEGNTGSQVWETRNNMQARPAHSAHVHALRAWVCTCGMLGSKSLHPKDFYTKTTSLSCFVLMFS